MANMFVMFKRDEMMNSATRLCCCESYLVGSEKLVDVGTEKESRLIAISIFLLISFVHTSWTSASDS